MKLETPPQTDTNNLFPVFLKLEELNVLLVGGGNVGIEKLAAVIANAPQTPVRVVALQVNPTIRELAEKHSNIEILEKAYEPSDIDWSDLVITAVNDISLSEQIRIDAKQRSKLVNAADKPELCDFYLGSVVKKGNLKIAISTNGKSPTIAKRLKDVLNEVMPDQIDEVLQNMSVIRNKLNGNFTDKVNKLNHITRDLAMRSTVDSRINERRWKKVATLSLFAFFFMILGYAVLSYIPLNDLMISLKDIPEE